VAAHLLGLCEREARLDLPGGSLRIHWDEASGHVFMTGPAEPVFDGVLAPALLGDPAEPSGLPAAEAVRDTVTIDCASVCVSGCLRPDDCPSAEARARVEALLVGRSLDELVAIATQSAELRGHARLSHDGGSGS
jgi:diaminopimelate epimerase